MIRRRVIVPGLEQGVFFRDTVRRLALGANVAGWARNNWDGTVEAVFEGEAGAGGRALSLLRGGGRGAAVVRRARSNPVRRARVVIRRRVVAVIRPAGIPNQASNGSFWGQTCGV